MNRKNYRALLSMLFSFFIIASPAFSHASNQTPKLSLDGRLVKENVYISDGIMYAPLREICEYYGNAVSWNDGDKTAQVDDVTFSLANGCGILNGRIYAPVRMIASAIGKEAAWDGETFTASIFAGAEKTGNSEVSDEDIYWLSKIIHAEAGGESMEGRIAVGNVILNRVASDEFPDTVYDVIFDRNYGVQFTPVSNGRIYCTADEGSTQAAIRALEGENVAGESLYFFNPEIAQSHWIAQNRTYVTAIGEHLFYA